MEFCTLQAWSFLILLAQTETGLEGQPVSTPDENFQQIFLILLIPIVVAFSFIVFVFYRARRESFFLKKEAELKLQVAEEELIALRAQINPHFIFNCLNSIHHSMVQKDTDAAGEHLIKFSKLIRYVLESSEQQTVPLKDEIEANTLYLQLEQFRLEDGFEYLIETDESLNLDSLEIPPMMIQPFLENAIWHGSKVNNRISMSFYPYDDQHLLCRIKDRSSNGAPKSNADLSHYVKKTSMGMTLMKDRFDTLNQLMGSKAEFSFVDKIEEGQQGREVTLILPFIN